MRIRITPNSYTFHAVIVSMICNATVFTLITYSYSSNPSDDDVILFDKTVILAVWSYAFIWFPYSLCPLENVTKAAFYKLKEKSESQ